MTTQLTTTLWFLLFLILSGSAHAKDEGRITGPYEYKNLSVYLVHGEDQLSDINVATLDEAMKAKTTTVAETGTVSQLQIRNADMTNYVFGLPGDIVKGGKQDRTLPNGFLLPPMSGIIPIDSFCVEKDRWSKREGEALATFAVSSKSLSGKELKLASKVQKSQGEVWKNVSYVQSKLSRNVGADVKSLKSASSLQLALEDETLKQSTDEFKSSINRAAKEDLSTATGMAFAINGKFNSADLFGSAELFNKLWPKLLDSAATEAIGELDKAGESGKSPAVEEIQKTMAESVSESPQKEKLAAGGSLLRHESKGTLAFDTLGKVGDEERRIHRNILAVTEADKARLSSTVAPASLPTRRDSLFNRIFGRR